MVTKKSSERNWYILISMSCESECAICASLAVALNACLGNSVKVRVDELPSSAKTPSISRWGLSRLSQSRRSRRAAIGSAPHCCQWPPTWKCDELDKFAVLLLKSSSPRPSRTKRSRIVCRPSGSAANIYYTPASRGPVGTGTFTIVSSSAALGLATGGCSVQCQCYYSPMCF